jgi:predicted nucleic acid-binding protein
MRLVDTSAWIEWLVASPTGEHLAPALPEQTAWLAPTIVQLELAKWLTREAGEERADQVIAFSQLCIVAPLDTEIALSAAEICGQLKLATADAIVYATALKYEADLLTCDAHFDGLPGVVYFAKSELRSGKPTG